MLIVMLAYVDMINADMVVLNSCAQLVIWHWTDGATQQVHSGKTW